MDFKITEIKSSRLSLDWALTMLSSHSEVSTSKIVNDTLIELRRFYINGNDKYFIAYSLNYEKQNEHIDGNLWSSPVPLKNAINDFADCCCYFSNNQNSNCSETKEA